MTNLLARGVDWLGTQRKTHMSDTVTYRRGAASVQLAATIGSTEFEQDDRAGLTTREQVRDYLIAAADLVLAGATVLPARGDRIEEIDAAGTTHFYEVLPLGGGKQHYRFSDPHRVTLRIHTKLIDTQAAD